MTFGEAEELGLWAVADTMNRKDAKLYASWSRGGQPVPRTTRVRFFMWYLNWSGQERLSDGYLRALYPDRRRMASFLGHVCLGYGRKRPPKQPCLPGLSEFHVSCMDCGWAGTVTCETKMDAVCGGCGSIHVNFL